MNTLSIEKDANEAASKFLFLGKTTDNGLRPRKVLALNTLPEAMKAMEEELHFWKMETSILLRMLGQLENRGHNTKASLKVLKEESVFLLENTFPAHEAKLNAIPAKKVRGRYRVQFLEQSHQKIRKAYQKFKLKVLWVIPSLIPFTIW